MYYVAGFFDPQLGRFICRIQSFPSRGIPFLGIATSMFLETLLRYTDPSGHEVCDEEGNCFDKGNYRKINGQPSVEWWAMMYGITFTGWNKKDQWAVIYAARIEGISIADLWGGAVDPAFAFRKAHGLLSRMLEISWNPNCYFCRPSYCYNNIMGENLPSLDYRLDGMRESVIQKWGS